MLKKSLIIICLTMLFSACAPGNKLLKPESAAVLLSIGIRNSNNAEVESAGIIVCHVVNAIDTTIGNNIDLELLFSSDWGTETNQIANDIFDIIKIQFTEQDVPLQGKSREYAEYVAKILSLTCKRLNSAR